MVVLEALLVRDKNPLLHLPPDQSSSHVQEGCILPHRGASYHKQKYVFFLYLIFFKAFHA